MRISIAVAAALLAAVGRLMDAAASYDASNR